MKKDEKGKVVKIGCRDLVRNRYRLQSEAGPRYINSDNYLLVIKIKEEDKVNDKTRRK